jgi:hypothetical protein
MQMNATRTTYELLYARGWKMESAPRANPSGRLDSPYVLRDRSGRIIARAGTRDALEEIAHRKAQA